jgi:phage gp46-like protein
MTQFTAADVLNRAVTAWTRQADIVATKDATNQNARADIMVDGQVLVPGVPVATLLYLEKLLQNVRELVLKLPVLDPEVKWGDTPDAATGLWRSEPEETVKTKKIPKAFIKAPATERHPAQVEMFTEDVVVGYWTKTLFSGAMPAGQKLDLLRRIESLAESVKLAREYANQAEAVDRQIAAALFGHLFAPGA